MTRVGTTGEAYDEDFDVDLADDFGQEEGLESEDDKEEKDEKEEEVEEEDKEDEAEAAEEAQAEVEAEAEAEAAEGEAVEEEEEPSLSKLPPLRERGSTRCCERATPIARRASRRQRPHHGQHPQKVRSGSGDRDQSEADRILPGHVHGGRGGNGQCCAGEAGSSSPENAP